MITLWGDTLKRCEYLALVSIEDFLPEKKSVMVAKWYLCNSILPYSWYSTAKSCRSSLFMWLLRPPEWKIQKLEFYMFLISDSSHSSIVTPFFQWSQTWQRLNMTFLTGSFFLNVIKEIFWSHSILPQSDIDYTCKHKTIVYQSLYTVLSIFWLPLINLFMKFY